MIQKLEYKDLDYHARIECGLCNTKKDLYDIKKGMEEKKFWYKIPFTGKYVCETCLDKLFG